MPESPEAKDVAIVANAIGKGLIAGFVGTLVMTAAQMIEMKLTAQGPETVPADAAGKVLGVKAKGKAEKQRFAELVHFGYGTGWGALRGLLSVAGLKGPKATLIHGLTVQMVAALILPGLKLIPPPQKQSTQQMAAKTIENVIYAIVTGWVFDTLEKNAES